MSSPATLTINKPGDEHDKPRPQRQISSPSKLTYVKVQAWAEEDEKEKDERQVEGANDSFQFAEASLNHAAGISSSELLLPSNTAAVQDLSPSPGGALQLVANQEEISGLVSKVYAVEGEKESERKLQRGNRHLCQLLRTLRRTLKIYYKIAINNYKNHLGDFKHVRHSFRRH